MSFVFPVLLGGLVLAGIPVLLHLILRQKPKTLPFPAFRFLVARHRSNQRKLQLRHWLLLLLRVLLLAGLILAVARPRILQRNLGLSSERPVAAVFVLDTSPSMDARSSDNRTRLDDAKSRALELLAELPAGSRVAVLTSQDTRGDWLTNPTQARQRIQNLKLQSASPPLPRSLIVGLKLLTDLAASKSDDVGTRLPRLLCVFSDSTQGAWISSQTVAVTEASDLVPVPLEYLQEARNDINPLLASLKSAKEKLPAASRSEFPETALREALIELRDMIPRFTPGDLPLQGRPAQLVAQAKTNAREMLRQLAPTDGVEKAKDDPLAATLAEALRTLVKHLTGYQTLWLDVGLEEPRDLALVDLEWPTTRGGVRQEAVGLGEKILLRAVLQAQGQDFQATVSLTHPRGVMKEIREVKAGSKVYVPFEIDAQALKFDPGSHLLEFKLDVRDALAANNQRYATLAVRQPRRVLVISDPPANAEADFARAVAVNDFQVDVKASADIGDRIVPGSVAGGYQAVVLFAVPEPAERLWRTLAKFVNAGGGLAIIPGGDEMKLEAYQTPAAQGVLPATWGQPVQLAKFGGKDAGILWNWQSPGVFRRPILQAFEKWNLDSTIDFVKFPPRVYTIWNTQPQAEAEILIRYFEPGQHPAVLERKLGAGKVLQMTTTFDVRRPAWNNYLETIHSFYVVITGLITRSLTGELDPVRVNFLLGQEAPGVLTSDLGERGPFSLRGPEAVEPIKMAQSTSWLPLPQAAMPGNYQIYDADKKAVAGFSVNLTPEESNLAKLPRADIENLFGAETLIPADRQANLRNMLKGHWSEPIELFPFFMVALLMMMAIENLLANRFYRSESEGTG